MTDEEMAEEYADKNKVYIDFDNDISDYGNVKKAFLAGLKAGRPQWHDLRKDPNDLPKNNAMVLTRLKNKRLKTSTFMENKFTIWNKDYDTYTKLYDVIAWCEPKFEE